MNLISCLSAGLLVLVAQLAVAQVPAPIPAPAPSVLVVQTFMGIQKQRIVISRGVGETETRELRTKPGDETEGYQQLFAEFYQQGYRFEGTFTRDISLAPTYYQQSTILIFVKRP